MTTPSDDDTAIDLLVELFRWGNDDTCRYHALRVLRQARGEPAPTFDDFKVRGGRQ